MFSTRTLLLLRLFLDYRMFGLPTLFAVLTLMTLCTPSTANPVIRPDLTQAVKSSSSPIDMIPASSLRTDPYSFPAPVAAKTNTPRSSVALRDAVELAFRVAEVSPFNDSDIDTENPDSSLTDTGATPPHPSRVTVAFLVLTLGLCLLAIYHIITHPPTHLIDNHIRPTISHISDRLPHSLILISQHLIVIYRRLSAHLPSFPSVNRVPSSLLPATLLGAFKSRQSRRRGPGLATFRVGEGRLMQWAQEDMNLLDMDSEADFMVNAEDPTESEELVDEYIPLSVGMGWKDRVGVKAANGGPVLPVRNYGSATSW